MRATKVVAFALALALAAGCSASTSGGGGVHTSEPTTSTGGGTSGTTAPAESTTSVTSAPAGPVLPGGGESAAWMGGLGCGASALTSDGQWFALREETDALRSDQVMDVAIGLGGTAWIATSSGVARVAGGEVTEVYDNTMDALAVDRTSGDLWGVGYQTAGRYDGTSWTMFPSTEFGEGDYVDMVKDVSVDADGRVWVATTSTVAMLDGEAWTWWGSGNGFPESPYAYYLESIVAAPDGRVWVSTSDGVLIYDGTGWELTDPGVGQPGRISASADGRVFVASYSDGFSTFDDGVWTVTTASPGALTNDRVRAVEVDGRGRLWIGTTWGLSIADDDRWTTYTMATSGLGGNCVEALAIDGVGPADLPAPTTPMTGSLSGSITSGGTPLGGTEVVLCSEAPGIIYSGETPCSGYPFEMVATTDADGRFSFADIPVGDYDLAWKVDETTWRSFMFGGEVPRVRAGQVTELAPIESESG
jgi:hypothetical protein